MMEKLIGITGGIGCGKSVVSRILRLQGFSVYDCDIEARRLMQNDAELIQELCRIAGNDIYDAEGKLNRRALASLIFNDESMRLEVNRVVHSRVLKDIKGWSEEADCDILFVESAILATSSITSLCTEVWRVEASQETCIRRIQRRNPLMTREETLARIRSQRAEYYKLREDAMKYGFQILDIHNDEYSALLPQISSS